MREFHYEHEDTILDIARIILVIIFLGSIGHLCWYFFIRLDHVETMSVRSKSWYREIDELEDYQTYECHTKYKDVCTKGDNDNEECHSESYQQCGWENHTRTIKTCPRSGSFPQKPLWEEKCPIRTNLGYYERRYERYMIDLSNDTDMWHYAVYSEPHYDTFPVRGKCLVGLNFWNSILKVEC